MEQQSDNTDVWHGTVDASGRILIPVELRRTLEVEPGTPLVWTRTEEGLSLLTVEENIRRIQAVYAAASPPEDVWTDALFAERRRDAAKEAAEMRTYAE